LRKEGKEKLSFISDGLKVSKMNLTTLLKFYDT